MINTDALLTALNIKIKGKAFAMPIAVACSGGLDSIALLHAVCHAGLNPIALHIDHGISNESNNWATYVKNTAHSFGASFDCERVQGLSQGMPSLENAARDARHAALATLCRKHGIKTLLLAHHANDQAETVLLNLLRGSGLTGMGMPAVRDTKTVRLERPWLNIPRKTIEDYAAQHGLSWVEDPSNLDQKLRRNAVRHTLWQVAESVEPRALPSILRFANLAQEAAHTEAALAYACLKPFLLSKNSFNINNSINDSVIDVDIDVSVDVGIDWFSAIQGHNMPVQAALLRAFLAYLKLKSPSQARLYAMLNQLNAKTGDGLRCNYAGWQFIYRKRILYLAHTLELNQTDSPQNN